jgi:hypothetical protein
MTLPSTTFSLPLPAGTGQGTGDLLIAAVIAGTLDPGGSPGITIVTVDDWQLLGSVGPVTVATFPGEGYFMRVYAFVGAPSSSTVDFTSDPDVVVWGGGCMRLTGFDPATAIGAQSAMVTGANTAPSTTTIPSIVVPAGPAILIMVEGGIEIIPSTPTGGSGTTLFTNMLAGNSAPLTNMSFYVEDVVAGATGDRVIDNDVRVSAMMLAIVPDTCLDGETQMVATDFVIGTD